MAAAELGCVVAVTGPVDHVSDGNRSIAVANGHELLGTVSGTGCMSTAITGCFLAVAPDRPLEAAAEALVAQAEAYGEAPPSEPIPADAPRSEDDVEADEEAA